MYTYSLSRKFFGAVLLLLSFLYFTGCGVKESGIAEESASIYFGSNRAMNLSSANFDSKDGPGDKLILGKLDMSIDEGYRPYSFYNMTPRNASILSNEDFKSSVQDLMANSGNDALVFVHGFNNSFLDAAKTVLQMRKDENLNGPQFVFSWPSAASTTSYHSDEVQATSELTSKSFRGFIDTILANANGKRVHLVAHSMGNRILLEGLRSYVSEMGNTNSISNVVFIAPDEALLTFKSILKLVFTKSENTHYTLYANRYDAALVLSKTLREDLTNQSDTRTGSLDPKTQTVFGNDNFSTYGPNESIVKANATEKFLVVDVSNLSRTGNSDHAYFRDNEPVVEDLSAVLNGQGGSKRREKLLDVAGKPYFEIKP